MTRLRMKMKLGENVGIVEALDIRITIAVKIPAAAFIRKTMFFATPVRVNVDG